MIYKLVTRVIQYFCFPNRPMKGGDILNFEKGGNLRKGGGGVDLKRGGMTPLTNHVLHPKLQFLHMDLHFLFLF